MNTSTAPVERENEQTADLEAEQHSYRELLGEMDAKEREWARVQGLLGKMIRRLALLAGDQDGAPSDLLDAIGAAAHKDVDVETLEQQFALLPHSIQSERPALDLDLNSAFADDEPDQRPPAATDDVAVAALVANLQEWLRQTAERLTKASNADSAILRVAELLAQPLDHESITEPMELLSDGIDEHLTALETERAGVQSLLFQVEKRLREMQRFVVQSQASLRSAVDSRQILDQGVQEQVEAINEELVVAQDVPRLREVIRARLDSVSSQFQRFKLKEDERHEADRARIEQLSARIENLEQESSVLRARAQESEQQLATDALTKAASRTAYTKEIAARCEQWQRSKQPLSLGICDIDHFKRINDQFGHASGDLALKAFSLLAMRELVEPDMFARIGGEEFAVIMPDTDLSAARRKVEAIRQAVEAAQFRANNKPVNLTVSIGVTSFRSGDDADSFYRRADEALYEAKSSGRNQVVSE